MTNKEFVEITEKMQKYYNKKLSNDDLKLYWNEFNKIDINRFKQSLNNLTKKSKFFPKITDIENELKKQNQNFENINLNSSYWYANLRNICDANNKKYFDITKGQELAPFKS